MRTPPFAAAGIVGHSYVEASAINPIRRVIPPVAGLNWGYDLSYVGDHLVRAPPVAYVTHPYPQKWDQPWEEKWQEDFGFVAERYPVIATEFGFMVEGDREERTSRSFLGGRATGYAERCTKNVIRGGGWVGGTSRPRRLWLRAGDRTNQSAPARWSACRSSRHSPGPFPPLMKHIVFAAAIFLSVGPVAAQDIPMGIPDTPGESPMDREREKNEERHHATFSRFFATTSVSAAPIFSGSGYFVDTVFEGGMEMGNGDALLLMAGGRSHVDRSAGAARVVHGEWSGGELIALGYQMGLARFSGDRFLHRSTVNFSMGAFTGEANMLYVEVSPRYVIRPTRYWSIPVGLKLTASVVSDDGRGMTTLGITAGLRRHFGQRESLK